MSETRATDAGDHELLRAVERRFDDLRDADREAVRVATRELNARMAGFPQEFARRAELISAAEALTRMDKDKLPTATFAAFVETYRIEQARADDARRTLAETLASATDTVKQQLIDERGNYISEENYATRHNALLSKVEAVERWEYKLVGGLVFATFVAPLLSAVIVYFFTKGRP